MTQDIESDNRIDSMVLDTYLGCLCILSAMLNAIVITRLGVAPSDVYHLIESAITLFGGVLGAEPGITVSLMVVTWLASFVLITLVAAVGLGAIGIHFAALYGLRGLVWMVERRR